MTAHSDEAGEMSVSFTLNGASVNVEVRGRDLLADVLRDKFDQCALQLGCEDGVCGTCTVLLSDEPVRSCTMLAPQAEGAEVTTLEGLTDHPMMQEIRQEFARQHALQCGFCTPGFLLTLFTALRSEPSPGPEAVIEELSGNLCRCTGYINIGRAVRALCATGREGAAT